MSKIDDKSDYGHILLSLDFQQYFGIEWQRWWLVGVTIPSVGRSPRLYTRLLVWAPQIFSGVQGSRVLCILMTV